MEVQGRPQIAPRTPPIVRRHITCPWAPLRAINGQPSNAMTADAMINRRLVFENHYGYEDVEDGIGAEASSSAESSS